MTEAEPLKPEDLKAAMLATFEKLEQTPLLDPDARKLFLYPGQVTFLGGLDAVRRALSPTSIYVFCSDSGRFDRVWP